ncbi:multidrug resistance-associated ABC transporter [Laetiporus sulphureus 93-53]|uniref:Multidrug resistance-associated ABC transporter n=1 Tax=Laetiporus sulphureus 93-53 TaxID=1314785 RepID=A0A165DLV2_9APHY|nr:multidrug resistance-associated ABC transporter [Laetiporus sulphureus 93-53]KZT05166.1 multidrug resistance-associated ABC transporter [Laetiporus sulphureus 93-53]
MHRALCDGDSVLSLSSPCVRDFWSAVVPATFVALVLVTSVPIPRPLRATVYRVSWPFRNFLTLPEAEALDVSRDDFGESLPAKSAPPAPLWRTLLLSSIALFETLGWLSVACFTILLPDRLSNAIFSFLVAATWLYATVRPMLFPTATPPADLLVLFTLHLVFATLTFGGALFDHSVLGMPPPSSVTMAGYIGNLVAISLLLLVILNMPLDIPSSYIKEEDIGRTVSPEDYTSLWGWMSFRWVLPLVERGTYNTLNESDIWALSPTMQSRPLYIKFTRTLRSTLLRRLWAANALDLILDFVLTYVSIVFNYAGPFFLKRILDSLDVRDEHSHEKRALAYIYAMLAFLSTLCKAQADVQHLWFGRRAATRIRSELMAAIYDKALKRKDFSGIVDKDASKAAKAPDAAGKSSAKADAKADDPKAGADIGKIVNLMAGDANKISNVVAGSQMIYGAPFEIAIAATFLYQLLGWSAFVGFIVLVIGWPLNNYVSRRAVRIHKGLSNARDKRMGVLNELIGAMKFIKFFAWEDRWIKRVMDAREVEMKWMIKSRVNAVCFSLIWVCAPILVSVTSFFVYVIQGNVLTVGTAFTAIALFNMIRGPLNVIPAWIVQILQAGVAMNRIATYLDEDEVDGQVSTLKRGPMQPSIGVEEGLGIVNGTFKWNEVEEPLDKQKGVDRSRSSSDETATAVDSQSVLGIGANGDHRFELRDINVIFPEGELTVVTGPTASGKTALLMALLGEMTRLEGRIVMSKNPSLVDRYGLAHTISYAAQTPWLRHQSIRDNILFGYPYDEERYNAVVECCALKPDLEMLEDGDATEIGARGVSLSGGQKARVALARAVYAPTKYVLLDDPLSAVDSHTARFLFERLFQGPLLAHRTVILVTHHVELVLPGAYYLVRMLDGRVDTQGMVKELRARGILEDIAHEEEVEAHREEQIAEAEEASPNAEIDAELEGENGGKAVDKSKKPRKLIEDEKRETGSVKWDIYKTYLKASSYWTWTILCFLILLTQILGVTEKVWIKIWGEAYGPNNSTYSMYTFTSFVSPEHELVMDDHLANLRFSHTAHTPITYSRPDIHWPPAQDHPLFYIGIYAAIALSAGAVNISGVITQYTGALRASRLLFQQLLVSVVRATMRWHDVTPQGRMLNRFSKDIETVDSSLAGSLQAVNTSLANFLASVITVVVVFPLFIFPASILGYFYRRAAVGYLNTGRDIRRMESNSRSPIFANFGELLEGIVTVRAFGSEQRFLDDLYKKVDLTTQMWYTFWMTNRWLLLYFDTLGATGVLVTTLFALSGYVRAGTAGICITSAMAFTNSVYWACRFWTALELDLNSVERVVEYLDLPQEPPAIIENRRPPAYWPSSEGPNKDSMISVEDLEIRYAPELPAVLHNVSFQLKAKERVGLLGRTGSGKSTLAMSILRFVDPTSGRIVIDGIDISTIGLHDLRSRLTFIPQDATLFSGTLRDNLDPFGEHEDSECLDVLYRVQMMSDSQLASQKSSREPSRPASIHEGREGTIASVATTATETEAKPSITLDMQVSPGGTNFSQGQRQLIAMARALLRRSSIIVLDEATSSIDFATDAKIQATIREEFNDSLLLTVAHRLRTVIDYDRLLVLDKGELMEFDTPYNLIQKENGIFRSMCLKSGTFTELETAARTKAESLQQ